MNRHTSWAKYGFFSHIIGSFIKPLQPPILVLSLPRSGSSWVGETLGVADEAMYLREPMNQSFIAYMGEKADETVFDVNPEKPPIAYEQAARAAFTGIPSFTPDIVKNPSKWNLRQRRSRRVVIKEINPLACDYFLRYKPKLIYMVRHPAGVLNSFQQLGWQSSEPEVYRTHGRYQGRALHKALDCFQDYTEKYVLVYENLCADPVREFRDIFNFAALNWTSKVEAHIQEHSTSGNRSDLWSTQRVSLDMIKEWKSYFSTRQLNDLREGFQEFDLPWFQLDEDW